MVTPPFDAQYAARSFTATSPSTDPIFTIAPPPHFRNSDSTARDTRTGPFKLTVIIRSHSSSLIASTVETCSVPALFTSTLSRPNRSTVPFTARSTSRTCVTSHSIANPAPPAFCTSPITSRNFSNRRPATATLAPSRANASAIARPIPVPPPVINATLPETRVTDFPVPASNRDVAASPYARRGARDSSIRLPALQAALAGICCILAAPNNATGTREHILCASASPAIPLTAVPAAAPQSPARDPPPLGPTLISSTTPPPPPVTPQTPPHT